ncbi:MAG: cytochrome P450, partial [Lysobacteraceae bacterium]
RARHGDLFALDMAGPLLSRDDDCAQVVAVFGEAHQRAVLGDIEHFVLPVSAAVRLGLPAPLVHLNASLHGMRGDAHAQAKAQLARALAHADAGHIAAAARQAVDAGFAARDPDDWPLLDTMRGVTLAASTSLLFGEVAIDGFDPAAVMDYFRLRREAAAPWAALDADAREALVRSGLALDGGLRRYRAAVCAAVRAAPRDAAMFGTLAPLALDAAIDDEAFVGHANVLAVSTNEPVAVAMAWTLLALSQLPTLRARLRDDDGRSGPGPALSQETPADAALSDAVLSESLRVLTPNALMVRTTRTAVRLGAQRLPARTEVLLCPFLSHREPALFREPERFLPARWADLRPSPYVYFPFGAGGHVCVGRALALRLLRALLAALSSRGDALLREDVAIDWRVHVMLLPTCDPRMRLQARDAGDAAVHGGVLHGGVRDIVTLHDDGC